jgi:hypothetical protein
MMVAQRKHTPSSLTDGSPIWLPQVENWFIGGAMLAESPDVVSVAGTVAPEDFRDETLGTIWSVMPYLENTGFAFVAQALGDRIDEVGGEPRLVELAFAQGAYLYRAPVFLEAHAMLVRREGEKRRRLRALSEEAQAVYAGTNVTPIYARPEYRGIEF